MSSGYFVAGYFVLESLQVAYNNEEVRTVNEFTLKIAVFAFDSISDEEASLAALKSQTPVGMKEYTYFDATYVNF